MTGLRPRRFHVPYLLLLALALALPLAAAALVAPVGVAAQDEDYDCVDFDSQEDAQAFYEEIGGPLYDPYNLDDDEDGVACEEWVRGYERAVAGEDGVYGNDGIDMDCADFNGPARAQRYFLEDGGSPRDNVDHLDPNHNGIACELGEPG